MLDSEKNDYNNLITGMTLYNESDLPGFGEEKEYDYKGCKIKVGRNVD